MKIVERLITLVYISLSTAFSVIAICFLGPAFASAGVAFLFLWLAIWKREARR